jgi:hypothetical protein
MPFKILTNARCLWSERKGANVTQEQFEIAVSMFTQTSVMWDGGVVRIEGGVVGIKWQDGRILVWNQSKTWTTRRASKLEILVQAALKWSTTY